MRVGKYILITLIGAILTLTLLSSYLFHENRIYQSENRKLIIQNDSILSANMELKNFLQNRKPSSTTFTEERPR